MTDCREQSWLFQDLGNRKVEVDFGGGYLSSDGGGLILRELERHSGLLRDFSGCFVDYRDQRYVEHSVEELVSQRIYGLVLGYEDLNDHDHLRLDPIHGLIAGKSDPLGQDRILERDKGKALADKTHLATALGYAACQHGYSVLFANAIDVINTLSAAQTKGALKSELKRYLSPALLLLDEIGYLPIDQRGADLLFQVISQRYERGSIVLTSNKAFKQWATIFNGDSTITSAVLDRLLHHAETVLIEGSSYRMKDRIES